MKTFLAIALVSGLLASAAWAQTGSTGNQPLNLKLPANSTTAPAASSSTAKAAPAKAASAQPNPSAITINGQRPSNAPGQYYGDTSGKMGNKNGQIPTCDDSTYNNTQVHGDVGMGVVSASHYGSGSYENGDVSFVKNTGSCDHPTGSVGVSIGVGRFNGLH